VEVRNWSPASAEDTFFGYVNASVEHYPASLSPLYKPGVYMNGAPMDLVARDIDDQRTNGNNAHDGRAGYLHVRLATPAETGQMRAALEQGAAVTNFWGRDLKHVLSRDTQAAGPRKKSARFVP
jgi:hypothetical protein